MTYSWYNMFDAQTGADVARFMDEADAPEVYEAFQLGLAPEDMALELQEDFPRIARDLNLSQKQAQSLMDYFVHNVQMADQQTRDHHDAQKARWVAATRTDKDIIDKGLTRVLAHAQTALKLFGSKELVEALDLTGIGLHPAFIKFAAAVGEAQSPYQASVR